MRWEWPPVGPAVTRGSEFCDVHNLGFSTPFFPLLELPRPREQLNMLSPGFSENCGPPGASLGSPSDLKGVTFGVLETTPPF